MQDSAPPRHAAARFRGPVPGDLLAHCAAHLRAVDLEVEETPSTLSVPLPQARVDLRRDAAGFSVEIEAGDAPALQQLREYLLSLLDHVMPGAVPTMEWSGDIARNTRPPNFHLARFHSVRRVARRFLRVTLDCEATGTLEDRPGMHFSLLLPPPGRDAAWPMLDDNGRTRWPGGRTACTVLSIPSSPWTEPPAVSPSTCSNMQAAGWRPGCRWRGGGMPWASWGRAAENCRWGTTC